MFRFLLILAALPPYLAFKMVKNKDLEPEPEKLVRKVFWLGVLSAIPSIVAERLLMHDEAELYASESLLSSVIYYTLTVGFIEEFFKFWFCKLTTWKNPDFDHSYDGVFYCTVSSLGFATIENIFYVLAGGAFVGILRAVTSIPVHFACGVIMGAYYSKAKEKQMAGQMSFFTIVYGLFLASTLHGIYDGVISYMESWFGVIIALIISMGSLFVSHKIINYYSENDTPYHHDSPLSGWRDY